MGLNREIATYGMAAVASASAFFACGAGIVENYQQQRALFVSTPGCEPFAARFRLPENFVHRFDGSEELAIPIVSAVRGIGIYPVSACIEGLKKALQDQPYSRSGLNLIYSGGLLLSVSGVVAAMLTGIGRYNHLGRSRQPSHRIPMPILPPRARRR